ncbi:MAG: type VI secretion system protein TssA [Labilithrix sp.]|nr:type VI secretion system protein TssA [Labilithrix sp.]MCW5811437.1 type VI secretion system protein TssA [Labilithrix sp.]
MAEDLEKLLEETSALRAPLTADEPAGADISLEPEFEAIKLEIDKLTGIDGLTPDWDLVRTSAEDLLASRTKDLRLAVWLTVAGVHSSGWHGLARGLVVCRALMVDLWEVALPKRDKARSNIIGWLAERAVPRVQELSVEMRDGADVRAAFELVTDIDRVASEKLGDAFQGIRAFISAMKSRVADIPKPPPTPPPPPPADSAPGSDPPPSFDAPAAEPAPSGGVALSTRAADADATTATIAGTLVALARSIAMVEPARAWAYSLHRRGIWLRIERGAFDAAPLDGAPDAATRERLGSLANESRWLELVFAGEEASALYPSWLDPHRFVALALERLGSAFNDARATVGRDTTDFVRRHRRLLDAKFTDETAAAAIETVAWLEAETQRWHGTALADVGRHEDRQLAARFADARNLVASGRHAEGLAFAMQLARRGSDPRDRFRANLDVARLASQVGANDVARPILESLVADATRHDLERWEPALAARLSAGLYRVLPADAPERTTAFETLCRIDPGLALRVQGRAHTTSDGAAPPAPIAIPLPTYVAALAPSAPENAPSAEPEYQPDYPSYESYDDGGGLSAWMNDDDD